MYLQCPQCDIVAQLGNKVTIFHLLSPQTLQVTANSCNGTQTFLNICARIPQFFKQQAVILYEVFFSSFELPNSSFELHS